MIRAILCILFLILPISACCPIPTFEPESPNIDGTLTRQDRPAASVQVFLAINKEITTGCSQGRAETRTDANGKFRFDRTGYMSPVLVFYGSPRYDRWALCFRFSDGLEAVWSFRDVFGGPPIQRLVCHVKSGKPTSEPLQLATAKDAQDIADKCQVENVRATPTPKR